MVILQSGLNKIFTAFEDQYFERRYLQDSNGLVDKYRTYRNSRQKFPLSNENFPVINLSRYTSVDKQTGTRVFRKPRIGDLEKSLKAEAIRLMFFIDCFIATDGKLDIFGLAPGAKIDLNKFEIQFGCNPLRTEFRFSFDNSSGTRVYKFFDETKHVAELRVDGNNPNQYTYIRKINPQDKDCNRGLRVQYKGNLQEEGKVELLLE